MRPIILTLLTLPLALFAFAGPGQVEINQTNALAGGVTPGDLPGFPVSLNESGSYVLTSSLIVPDENTTAIEIASAARNSSIDLAGFQIQGVTFCFSGCAPTGTGIGIEALVGAGSIRVENGMITGMGSHGIALLNEDYVRGVVARSNGGNGIHVGPHSSVIDSQAMRNGGAGIKITVSVAGESVLQGNLAVQNALVDTAALDIEGSRATGGNVCGDENCSPRGARRYYLTESEHTGATALTACTAGYHMASVWEIDTLSNLEYAAVPARGVSSTPDRGDQGSGPPFKSGWIRTGHVPGATGVPTSLSNCLAYSTNSGFGTLALPRPRVSSTDVNVGSWFLEQRDCSLTESVWCVED